MAETTVFVEASREVSVDPERAWSLLGSATMWSLRPGSFAFDAETADSEPIRCVLNARGTVVGGSVLTRRRDQPGVAATWAFGGRSDDVTFSVGHHRRGAVIGVALKMAVNRAAARYQKQDVDRILRVWLIRAANVLEGREPWPEGMPADVRQACAASPPLGPMHSVSESVLIAAPVSVVWKAVGAPGTVWLDDDRELVACGHVPGTPVQQPGEMQFFVSRTSDGQLGLSPLFVSEIADQRSAVTHTVPHQLEIAYLLTAEPEGTRLELTARWPDAVLAKEPQGEREMTAILQSTASAYKSAIEESGTGA